MVATRRASRAASPAPKPRGRAQSPARKPAARAKSPARKPAARAKSPRRKAKNGNGIAHTLQTGREHSLVEFLMLRVMVIFEEGSNVPPGSPPAPQTGWYAASSSTFALLGLFAMTRFTCPVFPGHQVEAVICGIQSICSWGNDVHSFGRPSKWKNADRLVASVNIMWQMCKLIWLEMTLLEYVVWIGGLCVALACFQRGQKLLHSRSPKPPTKRDFSAFLAWHAVWHCVLPLAAGAWMWIRGKRLGCACVDAVVCRF